MANLDKSNDQYKRFVAEGPGVEDIKNRKEINNRHALTSGELIAKLKKFSESGLTGLKSLVTG
jgi:hypothetical protein